MMQHSHNGFAALVATNFHACMHGANATKRTRLLASAGLYGELAAKCDNSHPHKPSGSLCIEVLVFRICNSPGKQNIPKS